MPFTTLVLELRPLLDALTGETLYQAPARLAYVTVTYVVATWLVSWLVASVAIMRKVCLPPPPRAVVGCGRQVA